MVCSMKTGRMGVMARLIEAGSFAPRKTGEVSQHKLALQYIYKEVHEANEANLLDEEDMDVFGLKPMADPLHLVSCDGCKKPIMTNQYAAHAELCNSLRRENILEIDGALGHRKPPTKKKKKPNQRMPVKGTSEILDVDDSTASKAHVHRNSGISISFSMDSKRNSANIDTASMMDSLGFSHESTCQSGTMEQLSAKRTPSEGLLRPEVPEIASGLTKTQRTLDVYSYISVPLATKIYYSQRSRRLRFAISHQYHNGQTKELPGDAVSPQASQQGMPLLNMTSQKVPSLEQKEASTAQKADQNSEVYLNNPVRGQPSSNSSHQLHVSNVARHQATSEGVTRSRYHIKPNNFSGNSGKLLGTKQQPSGSLPVV